MWRAPHHRDPPPHLPKPRPRQGQRLLMTIQQAAVTAPEPRSVAEVLAESELRDLELRLRLDAWADGYRVGADGQFSAGYAAAVADMKAAEHAIWNHVRHLPTEAERWAVRGERRTR